MEKTPLIHAVLGRMARKYIWWKTPDEAMAMPDRVMVQVMDIGDYDDVQQLIDCVGEAALRVVVANAQAGQFGPRSWVYWHYRLGLTDPDSARPPPLPTRRFA